MILTIRRAEPDEAGAIADLFLCSWRALTPDIPVVHTDDQVRAWMRDSVLVEKRVYVVPQEKGVIAMMAVSEDGDGGWIDHLYVAPEHAGHGVGTALVKHALNVLPAPVSLYSFQCNVRARRFYEARGFTAVKFGDGSGNEQKLPDVMYRWG